MIARLPNGELRRELFESVDGLRVLGSDEPAARQSYAEIIVPVLLEVGKRDSDESLVKLLEGRAPSTDVLGALADWAEKLDFEAEADKPTAAPALLSVPEPVAAQQSEPSPVTAVPSIRADAVAEIGAAGASVAVSAIDTWVLRLRGLNSAELSEFTTTIGSQLRECINALARADSVAELTRALAELSSFQQVSADWLARLPKPADLATDREEADAAYDNAAKILDVTDLDDIVQNELITPAELTDIVRLISDAPTLDLAPEWMWRIGDVKSDAARPSSNAARARSLAEPRRRAVFVRFADLVQQLGEPVAVQWLPPLPLGRPPDDHLIEWFEKSRDFLVSIPVEVRTLVCREGIEGIDVDTMLADGARIAALQGRLGPGTYDQLRSHLASIDPAHRSDELSALSEAVDFFERSVGSLDGIAFGAIVARAARQRATTTTRDVVIPERRRVGLDHNWTETGHRVTLVAARRSTDLPYAEIAVPLALEADQPAALEVQLRLNVRGKLRADWPSEWPDIEPTDPFRIYPHDWRKTSSSGASAAYVYPFAANIPIRLLRSDRLSRFEVRASLLDPGTQQEISEPKDLRWENIETDLADVRVEWADTAGPDYVERHPIGPQESAKTILHRLRSGSSVAVIAPRRFGKSTLVEYLVREGRAFDLAIPPALWCTAFASSGGFDYERLWNEASSDLSKLLDAPLGMGRTGFLPDRDAFDHVRRNAAERGYKAVVLLFDEAQLFFPSQTSAEISSTIKMLLESHWAKATKGMVPLLLGFVGLPSMRQRIGGDLMGVLNPVERSTMKESELQPLIKRMAPRLQTTEETRIRLAETSGNLLVLRALLDRLAAQLNREQRRWANYHDIFSVEESLRRDLQMGAGESETVATFVRDILNGGDRVEHWQPIPSFPVAVALAQKREAGRSLSDAVDAVVGVLEQWCAGYSKDEVHPRYDRDLVVEHIRQLHERGVLRDGEFSSRLLEAWLRGVASRTAQGLDEPFRDALFRGAQRRIQVPQGAEPVNTGGQAEVRRFEDRAYRIRHLENETDRQHFLDTAQIFDTLRTVLERRDPGSDHIFEPIDIGLSSKNASDAVQIYRWVEGNDISASHAALGEDLVIDLGVSLARALTLIHRENILHRDICPRNIIIDDSRGEALRPVLIDFGFARVASKPMITAMAGEHFAPEVRGLKPFWSKAADVFGLASTLRWVLNPNGLQTGLLRVLERATAERPEDRLSAEQLLNALEELSEQTKLEQRKETIWRDIQKSLSSTERHSPWFMPLLRKSRSTLVGLAMGFHRDPLDRFQSIAEFLNRTVESCPAPRMSLNTIQARQQGQDAAAIEMIRALRNDRAHGERAMYEDTYRLVEQFTQLSTEEQRQVFRRAIAVVSRATRVTSLTALLEKHL
jgi:serine/threonine protein kinase